MAWKGLSLLAGVLAGLLPAIPEVLFRDAAEETGLHFWHLSGATGQHFLPEIMGAGVAVFDYDGDGDLDVYLIQGTFLEPGHGLSDLLVPPPRDLPPGNRMFRNELISRSGQDGSLRFTDVTEESGLGLAGYGMGVTAGDIDNDGDIDLYVTNFGPNVLFRNNGDGTFSDITAMAGVADDRWSTSAAFFDYDRDGHLDLFSLNYIDFTVAGSKECFDSIGGRDYCSPAAYRPLPDRLFRNEGGGKFRDVTAESGIAGAFGPGLGVIAADFNQDGWDDVYVANDGTANLLWINRRDGTFAEEGLLAGAAYNADGMPEGSMGVTAGDFDGDGDPDLFMTHLAREKNTLYVNDGSGSFHDESLRYRLAEPSFPFTGFGTEWFDYDGDGLLDLLVANGAVTNMESLRGEPYPYHQTNQLFRQTESSRFVDVSAQAGPDFQLSEVSRGAAFGDIDNDGDIDVVVTNNNGPVRLLINEAGNRKAWLLLRLLEKGSRRPALGAAVGLIRSGRPPLWRRAHTDGSYLSASDPRVHFGLGDSPSVDFVEVRWPDGSRERWQGLSANQEETLLQGSGQAVPGDD